MLSNIAAFETWMVDDGRSVAVVAVLDTELSAILGRMLRTFTRVYSE